MTTPNLRSDPERGASLLIALAVMILASTLVAALMTFASTSVRSGASYRGKSERDLAADAAVTLAVASARPTLSMGRVGTPTQTFTHEARGLTVTCTGEGAGAEGPASGSVGVDGRLADRRLRCKAVEGSGQVLLDRQVVLHDGGGATPGHGVEVLSENRPA